MLTRQEHLQEGFLNSEPGMNAEYHHSGPKANNKQAVKNERMQYRTQRNEYISERNPENVHKNS